MINVEYVVFKATDKASRLLNKVVDVVFKLFIDSVVLVDNEFKLVNIDVDVACKLEFVIFNFEYVDGI